MDHTKKIERKNRFEISMFPNAFLQYQMQFSRLVNVRISGTIYNKALKFRLGLEDPSDTSVRFVNVSKKYIFDF